MDILKAPFPWFGGKSRVAAEVWAHFGNVPNYVEPFAGSLAVLLGRPHAPKTETVNDKDCYLSNFWRAIQYDPEQVARYADWPVNEADQHARHLWLCRQEEFREQIKTDPDFYDPRIAGYWVWGQCSWIGTGWCTRQLPHLGDAGQGINRKLPHLGNAGQGINRQLPHLGNAGRGIYVREYFQCLSDRLRDVRVACGDWKRVLGPSVTIRHGVTAVFLDPPYDEQEHSVGYTGGGSVFAEVVRWAVEQGSDPKLRIALCGYEADHGIPDSWLCVPWKARGGYGSQGNGRGRENAHRERIWFSPHCLRDDLPMSSHSRQNSAVLQFA